jgi:hypothetical protein
MIQANQEKIMVKLDAHHGRTEDLMEVSWDNDGLYRKDGGHGISTVRSRDQGTSGEDTTDWKDLACAVVICISAEIGDGAIIKCSHESCV